MARTGETNWGGDFLFHYTEAAQADEIAAEGYFQVGSGSNFGLGLYATDLPPHEATPDEIRAVCFEEDAADSTFDGVLVLLGDHPRQPFFEVDHRVFLLPAEEGIGELISLHLVLLATGRRYPRLGWKLTTWADGHHLFVR